LLSPCDASSSITVIHNQVSRSTDSHISPTSSTHFSSLVRVSLFIFQRFSEFEMIQNEENARLCCQSWCLMNGSAHYVAWKWSISILCILSGSWQWSGNTKTRLREYLISHQC
jgi:hypothetical protein